MGACISSLPRPHKPRRDLDVAGPEKSQVVTFSTGLENLLRDSELQKSPTGQSGLLVAPGAVHHDHRDTLRRDANAYLQQRPQGAKAGARSQNAEDGFQPFSRASIPKPVDRKPFSPSTGQPAAEKLSNGQSRKRTDRRPPTPSMEGIRAHTSEEAVQDGNTPRKFQGWQSLEHLLKESSSEAMEGRKSMSRYSPARRPAMAASPKVYGEHGHGSRVSPAPRPVARNPLDRRASAERRPVERNASSERRGSERSYSTDGSSSVERRTVERNPTPESRTPLAERRFVSQRQSGDRKSVDRPFVDKNLTPPRKTVDRNSRSSVRAVDPSDFAGALSMSERRPMDRGLGDASPDRYSSSPGLIRRSTKARNGRFTPEADSRQSHRRFGSSFSDVDVPTQKLLIDTPERRLQARIDAQAALFGRAAHPDRHHDPAATDHSSLSGDVRSAAGESIDEFTRFCRQSAAKAQARDLDAFKSLTSIDSSTDSSPLTLNTVY